MPSYSPPPDYRRFSIVDSLERTATSNSIRFFEREAERVVRSRAGSRFHTSRIRNYELINSLQQLLNIESSWNSYGTPPPNAEAIARATRLLDLLANAGLSPESVSASAEGGVATVFMGAQRNRAIIESLNNGEFYMLLYDLDGRSETSDLSNADSMNAIRSRLLPHIEGKPLAP